MKVKGVISLMMAGVLMFGAGVGTTAYFQDTLVSTSNEITAAKFNPSAGEILSETFSIERIKPSDERSYDLTLKKNETETDLHYRVDIQGVDTSTGEQVGLFEKISDAELPLLMEIYHNDELVAQNYKGSRSDAKDITSVLNVYDFVCAKAEEKLKLVVVWPKDHVNSIRYQGSQGNINVNVQASQFFAPEMSWSASENLVTVEKAKVKSGNFENTQTLKLSTITSNGAKLKEMKFDENEQIVDRLIKFRIVNDKYTGYFKGVEGTRALDCEITEENSNTTLVFKYREEFIAEVTIPTAAYDEWLK